MEKIKCHLADIRNRQIIDSEITIDYGKIASITPCDVPTDAPHVMPGFIDAHVHIESTLLTPENYAKLAIRQGNIASVCDPHEIANVLGKEGIEFMLDSAAKTRYIFSFGVPSCVPSTCFETAGATLTAADVEELMASGRFYGLAEMMNFPGVLMNDRETMAKIDSALKRGLKVDGHAPGLNEADSERYVKAGISTDHEMFDLNDAKIRLKLGQKIQIREGSAACNLEQLMPLLNDPQNVGDLMLCTDDKYPDELMDGYINQMVARCVAKGIDVWNVLYAACVAPVEHYNLPVGTLRQGDPADFIIVRDFKDFNVLKTYINGECVYGMGDDACVVSTQHTSTPNNFTERTISIADLQISATPCRDDACVVSPLKIKVISATEGALYTTCSICDAKIVNNFIQSDTDHDILKLVIINRYENARPAIAFINGFGLKRGAIASTIAHDSHNIIALGCSDEEVALAINTLERSHGGFCVVDGTTIAQLPLPVAGLMSNLPGEEIAAKHIELKRKAAEIGCRFKAPYMTLAFMVLPVIPELKLTDKGLFDGIKFGFTELIS